MADDTNLTWDQKQARLRWEEFEQRQADQAEQKRQIEENRDRQRGHFDRLQISRFGYTYNNYRREP